MNEQRPTHLDLFSGIGGFALGCEAAGFETIGFAELDPFCSALLNARWPKVPNFRDVRNVPAQRCHLLTGGFPCQPFSGAGRRRGTDDDRYLWTPMRDAIERCRPDWLIIENVVGIIDLVLDRILADLEALQFSPFPLVIPACAVGLPQIEGARVWIMAAAHGLRRDPRHQISKVSRVAQSPPAICQNLWRIRRLRGNSGRVFQAPVAAFDRVDYGLPGELDRVKALGNSVSPQIVEVLARAIRAQIQI